VRRDTRLLRAVGLGVAVAMGLLLAWMVATAALVAATLAPPDRALLVSLLGPRLPLLVMATVALAGVVAALLQPLYRRYVAAPARLLEQARVRLQAEAMPPLSTSGGSALQGLAEVANALVQQRERLREDMTRQVAEASHGIELERSRLAALMAELTLSVVVCNLDGRILLYNPRARQAFKALSDNPGLAEGAELIGLGRSIYAVFDRRLVAHALDSIQRRLQRGDANPAAQFVTSTPGGQLLRVQMAPVREPADRGAGRLSGFVLLLENITREYEQDAEQDQLLLALTEGQRASLGNLQAAVELLDAPSLAPAERERFLGIVRDEVTTMSARLQDLSRRSAQEIKTRWPLEDMLGADLVAAALRRIESACTVRTGTQEVEPALWLKVDSFALLEALAYLAVRLVDEFAVRTLMLRLQAAGGRAQLDLIWTGQAMSTETVMSWESEPMQIGSAASALSVRDVMQRHGGEFWFERDRVRHQAFFRFLLPLAEGAGEADAPGSSLPLHDSRPEFYDFDLFQHAGEAHRELDQRSLASLSYTVFDTETTGLEPSAGDEIIQIGAARIVNGKLLRQESFEQLVDPRRDVPPAGIPIHGIRPEMLVGQPTIDQVLPAFHAYARDTVLVAHNAAFDMRFLQLKEAALGLVFDQPVLDTLLLSAVVHPQQDSHRLEAIAERFGITVVGRHTALGDAMVTAEVWLRLIPLLAAQGIHTLAQAREAAQQTYYARLRY